MRLWIFLVALVFVSYWLTGLYRSYAIKKNILDIPNTRSSHAQATPLGGGVSLILSFYIGLGAVFIKDVVEYPIFVSLLVGGTLVALVGWLDDKDNIPPLKRLIVQILAAVFAMAMISDVPKLPVFSYTITLEHVGYILCLIAIVWSTNLFNFMDGIDGIAAVEIVTVSVGAAVILYFIGEDFYAAVSLIVLAAATGGFLIQNFPPAKIFMGDVGSGFLGFTLGVYAIGTSVDGNISPWSWLILYGLFLVDATTTLLQRMFRQKQWYRPHRTHTYQILSQKWKSHKKVTMWVLIINVFYLFPMAAAASIWQEYGIVFCIVSLLPLIFIALYFGAGKTDQSMNSIPNEPVQEIQ